jgi:hypothetical protein
MIPNSQYSTTIHTDFPDSSSTVSTIPSLSRHNALFNNTPILSPALSYPKSDSSAVDFDRLASSTSNSSSSPISSYGSTPQYQNHIKEAATLAYLQKPSNFAFQNNSNLAFINYNAQNFVRPGSSLQSGREPPVNRYFKIRQRYLQEKASQSSESKPHQQQQQIHQQQLEAPATVQTPSESRQNSDPQSSEAHQGTTNSKPLSKTAAFLSGMLLTDMKVDMASSLLDRGIKRTHSTTVSPQVGEPQVASERNNDNIDNMHIEKDLKYLKESESVPNNFSSIPLAKTKSETESHPKIVSALSQGLAGKSSVPLLSIPQSINPTITSSTVIATTTLEDAFSTTSFHSPPTRKSWDAKSALETPSHAMSKLSTSSPTFHHVKGKSTLPLPVSIPDAGLMKNPSFDNHISREELSDTSTVSTPSRPNNTSSSIDPVSTTTSFINANLRKPSSEPSTSATKTQPLRNLRPNSASSTLDRPARTGSAGRLGSFSGGSIGAPFRRTLSSVNVKRRSSADLSPAILSAAAYSSFQPSPAVSFLSMLAEKTGSMSSLNTRMCYLFLILFFFNLIFE